jgi:hypothetical protein
MPAGQGRAEQQKRNKDDKVGHGADIVHVMGAAIE